MKYLCLLFALLCSHSPAKVVMAIHGGTGVPKKELSAEDEKNYRAELESALNKGYATLKKSGGLDAVEIAIRYLEDSPIFNAGKGAVFTWDGRNELDASIMEGKTKKAGAVGGVTVLKNPISAARAVMEKSEHVFLVGRGAEVFATQMGLEIVDPGYFWTEKRWKALQEKWKKAKKDRQRGTVGAVALDAKGNLFAGTSTGGMNGKKFGRLGDSPIIGAGTYADNEGVAVSGTGWGEYFIRFTAAASINALVKLKGLSVEAAANEVILKQIPAAGGDGGVIVLDAKGNFAAPYHDDGLYRAWVTEEGKVEVALY